MDISYWQSRWNKDKTGWHMEDVYPLLPEYWPKMEVSPGDVVLVPLCGKSLDMLWLAEQGYKVVGVEVSKKAVDEFAETHFADFSRYSSHGLQVIKSNNITLWQGDFLKFPSSPIETIDVIYDKAALVAFPPDKRELYANKIVELNSNNTRMLLQTFEYNQKEMTGPPFAVFIEELQRLYEEKFDIIELCRKARNDLLTKFKLRGLQTYFDEILYLLISRTGK